MAGAPPNYTTRRAPNVSQYLANLNNIPSAQELAAQNDIPFNDNDLDFLAQTEFFDFDQFNPHAVPEHFPAVPSPAESVNGKGVPMSGMPFQFGEFQTFPPQGIPANFPQPPPHPHAVPFNNSATPPQTGDKRKPGPHAVPAAPELEDISRFAAEEDKRRRNTAASARFRVKKKQREQELEKKTKDMSDKLAQLEGKVQQLEMENKWLKGLITDKNDGKMPEMSGEREKEFAERSTETVKRGIGTEEDVTEVDVED